MLVWKFFWDALGRFSCQDLVRSSPAAGAFLAGPGMKILVKVFCMSLWEDLVEIPVTCCQMPFHDLVQVRFEALDEVVMKSSRCPYMISYKSLWEDLVEILLKSTSRGPCIKVLEDALHWCLCVSSSGMLLGSSCLQILWDPPCIEGPAAARSIMSDLICYCSIATVAGIWYIDFLPATLFGVSCRYGLFIWVVFGPKT